MCHIVAGSFAKSSSSNAATCAEQPAGGPGVFPVTEYDLAATLNSGQCFRWRMSEGGWEGVIGSRWVRLRTEPDWATPGSGPRETSAARTDSVAAQRSPFAREAGRGEEG